ncbi:hypothetical protein ABMA32_14285 [Mesorhizobium sp. VNQ89]|uniref:COG3904 family protein n=1 Tax=Mesorhizobium quangtriensis TaxID=3157709 RepID=UPI0032B70A04
MSDMQAAGLPDSTAPRRNVLLRYVARFDDAELVRSAFIGMLVGAVAVVAFDLRDMAAEEGWFTRETFMTVAMPAEPVLAPAVQTDVPSRPEDKRRVVTAGDELLNQPMTFTLASRGVLLAEGTIDSGAVSRLAAELEARGEYVRVVSLNSPGGALEDAMAMAKLIRDKGVSTEVVDGALCASSCPLVLAGGLERTVAPKAAVGVHQFYVATKAEVAPAQVMADAQMTTARISRHLIDMDIDPALWLHALDTPPQALYYFSPEEMARYRLVTAPVGSAQTQ